MREPVKQGSLSPSGEEPLLTTEELATLFQIHPATLRIARSRKTLPLPWLKIGGVVRYRRKDVEDFLQASLKAAA